MSARMAVALTADQLALLELAQACQRETKNHRTGKASDSSFCLEIFRRALAIVTHTTERAPMYVDEPARGVLVSIYSDFIKAQINRRAFKSRDLDELVQNVWLRFWQAARSGLTFTSLQGALDYLRQTTMSALLEECRRQRGAWREQSLDQLVQEVGDVGSGPVAEEPFPQYLRQRFDTRCRELLTNPLERRLFWMRYSMGYAPREIASILAAEGLLIKNRMPTARAVSDALDLVFRRLEQDSEIQDLLGDA
jgi:DNA-directed RNA polymerase specialized sigma24 family protein